MLYTNSSMQEFLKSKKDLIAKSSLDPMLWEVINKGFYRLEDCVFLREIFPKNYMDIDFDQIYDLAIYRDYSGLECVINKFHIEDFIQNDVFIQAILFAKRFRMQWKKQFLNQPITTIVGFQEDEIGKLATFTFHCNRTNEIVYDIDNIEKFSQPVFIEVMDNCS
ncbi:hypothetical protein [Psychrobacter sp. I-STPA6b]|uniref:hypothetical protein n=1 Tax=Psychrobacter sp. I-STPA6b TaxID=2585718 RepID=UPI001D0C7C8E|nr:hypothetical protein [Psychrobacter sp. I-STPA6b]